MPLPSPKDAVPNTELFPAMEGLTELDTKNAEADAPLAAPPFPSRRQDHSLDKTRQATRLRRLGLVGFFAASYLASLGLLYVSELIGFATLAAVGVAVLLTLAGLFAVFASGLNQKAREKNLTAPIALCALLILLGTVYIAPQARMLFAPFTFVIIAYGMYRLDRKTLLMLTAVALAGYAAVLGLQSYQGFGPHDWQL